MHFSMVLTSNIKLLMTSVKYNRQLEFDESRLPMISSVVMTGKTDSVMTPVKL